MGDTLCGAGVHLFGRHFRFSSRPQTDGRACAGALPSDARLMVSAAGAHRAPRGLDFQFRLRQLPAGRGDLGDRLVHGPAGRLDLSAGVGGHYVRPGAGPGTQHSRRLLPDLVPDGGKELVGLADASAVLWRPCPDGRTRPDFICALFDCPLDRRHGARLRVWARGDDGSRIAATHLSCTGDGGDCTVPRAAWLQPLWRSAAMEFAEADAAGRANAAIWAGWTGFSGRAKSCAEASASPGLDLFPEHHQVSCVALVPAHDAGTHAPGFSLPGKRQRCAYDVWARAFFLLRLAYSADPSRGDFCFPDTLGLGVAVVVPQPPGHDPAGSAGIRVESRFAVLGVGDRRGTALLPMPMVR